jgi:hypothetical protein
MMVQIINMLFNSILVLVCLIAVFWGLAMVTKIFFKEKYDLAKATVGLYKLNKNKKKPKDL